jgi:hypothetical protein
MRGALIQEPENLAKCAKFRLHFSLHKVGPVTLGEFFPVNNAK